MSASILVLNGPNLNLLGAREPHIYGHTTLANINQNLAEQSQAAGLTLETLQSNAEHVLIERIQAAMNDDTAFIIINPGAFTHTSVAIRDAFAAAAKPFIEVHISNIHAREAFRHHSYLSDIALGVICGLGIYGYEAALWRAIQYIKENGH
nr:type II 3-dehydroquinate dehydratase [Snodgrassella alvi]